MNIEKVLPQFQLSVMEYLFKNTDVQPDVTEGLGERQKLVYNTLKLYDITGATAKELSVQLHNEGLVMSSERNSVHPRLNELSELGLVKTIGKRTCQYTDRKVSVYKTV